jgi:UDP-glucose:(heptosyl)LPS alpha-1,3-glucosyltransferase
VRILLIARPFVFHGGVERATDGLLGGLVACGQEVDLLTTGRQAPAAGVSVRRLWLPPLPAGARLLALAVAARVVTARGRWDVVQSHERTLSQDVYRAGEGSHRAYLDSVGGARGRPLYHRMVLALERRLFARTPRIVAIAARGQREIQRDYGVPPERIRVVYNGVDLERFHPCVRGRERASARREAGVEADAFAMLFVGSGYERKGLATAIGALAELRDPTVRLIVIGKGRAAPYQLEAARRGVRDQVVWLGARPDTERWYGAADVVVLPTHYEPFGNVHLEALASGVPVVTSTLAGGAELIREGVNGFAVAPRDPSAVAGAIDRVRASSPGSMAEAARSSAEPFTFVAQAARFLSIYRELRAGNPQNS